MKFSTFLSEAGPLNEAVGKTQYSKDKEALEHVAYSIRTAIEESKKFSGTSGLSKISAQLQAIYDKIQLNIKALVKVPKAVNTETHLLSFTDFKKLVKLNAPRKKWEFENLGDDEDYAIMVTDAFDDLDIEYDGHFIVYQADRNYDDRSELNEIIAICIPGYVIITGRSDRTDTDSDLLKNDEVGNFLQKLSNDYL